MAYYGWAGTILNVDLTKEKVAKEPLPRDLAIDFIGGTGLASRLLYLRTRPGLDPFDPEMAYIVATGPLTGTIAPSTGRIEVATKSPATEGLIGVSNAGGFLSPEIKWAGYDAIVITGRAKEPVWIWIDDDRVEIRSAKDMWGKTTWETIDMIHEKLGDPTVATMTIGPAGEKLNVFALALVMRSRALGKIGAGAVMGSKNLKALAARGTKGVKIYNPDEFEKLSLEVRDSIKASPVYAPFSTYSTPMFYEVVEAQGAMPTYNFQEGIFPEGRANVGNKDVLIERLSVKSVGCYNCPISCGHWCEVPSGPYAGTKIEGIEYYFEFVFGPNLGTTDWDFIEKCAVTCNTLGLEVTAGHVLSWVAELYQRGILSKKDLDGVDLTWGNQQAILEMLRKMAYREGIGDILASGFTYAANKFGKGAEKYTPLITRMTTSECPRARYDVQLSHVVCVRGGDHNKALPLWNWLTPPEFTQAMLNIPDIETAKKTHDIYDPTGKPMMVDFAENFKALSDSLITCMWAMQYIMVTGGYTLLNIPKLLTAATGVEYTTPKVMECGRRITVQERAYNVREGWGREVYSFSPKWIETAFPRGPQAGVKLNLEIANKLIDEFLDRKGFDPKTGFPRRKALEELGLKDVADDLEKMKRLTPEKAPEKKAK